MLTLGERLMMRPRGKTTWSRQWSIFSLSWVARNGISQNPLGNIRSFLKMHNRGSLCIHGRAGRILTRLVQMKREQEPRAVGFRVQFSLRLCFHPAAPRKTSSCLIADHAIDTGYAIQLDLPLREIKPRARYKNT